MKRRSAYRLSKLISPVLHASAIFLSSVTEEEGLMMIVELLELEASVELGVELEVLLEEAMCEVLELMVLVTVALICSARMSSKSSTTGTLLFFDFFAGIPIQ
jgi:hypothetical protein